MVDEPVITVCSPVYAFILMGTAGAIRIDEILNMYQWGFTVSAVYSIVTIVLCLYIICYTII